MTGGLTDRISALWRSAAAFARDRRRRMAAVSEVDAMDPHERACVLGEAGLTRREFGVVMRTPFVSESLLAQGMCEIGIDPEAFCTRNALWHRDMQRVCVACPARSRCRRDLATGDFARRYRHYCLNAESLGEIAAGRETRA